MWPKAEWAIDSEAMRAKGIIVLVYKIQLVELVKKNIETKHLSVKTLQVWRAIFATSRL